MYFTSKFSIMVQKAMCFILPRVPIYLVNRFSFLVLSCPYFKSQLWARYFLAP
ncbi:rCG32957 [Rattus norvegicus]|uniref:RCG32957 n=1 Tax=Rattus norvegicus TaxID=10116 RepID=A6HDJ6_RAT|nr:rCG32957 [Rattus norvegicus]